MIKIKKNIKNPKDKKKRTPNQNKRNTDERKKPFKAGKSRFSSENSKKTEFKKDYRKHAPHRTPEKDIVYGINPVEELIDSNPSMIKEIFIQKSDSRRLEKIIVYSKQRNLKISFIDMVYMDKLTSAGNHQGVAAEINEYKYCSVEKVINREGKSTIFLLDSVTDVGNFASLIRSFLAFDIDLLIIPKDRSASVTGRVHRLSSGASLKLPIAQVTNLRKTVLDLKKAGYFIYGAEGNTKKEITDFEFTNKTAIIMGNEENGVRPLLKKECDDLIRIPMSHKIDSLNVAVSGAIFAYVLKSKDFSKIN